ncbi:SGNH/GDSL hydrolase family protein [Methylocystis parvus]|uniref:SGNH/GDSL hydrolase family protein n=1 Tax=Methylocystis parvus TaxID=134 RepID=A0A6B8M8K8_9HYPH|nr:SGNH/GDSL hydrolase family protein [Methylocystis parvus]QGM98926.1 SGNH/GDSL hydrolase family protein [Methylocystis parvus]WBK00719.1 SGNH/GDSL hydrolase family protein [Methylocystis parvus OBBP]
MRIVILGGSNSGPKNGWAASLAEIAPEHRIENRFLGAVGSLFGLLRLLKMQQERGEKPDVVVFEYALNDSLWLLGGNITMKLVEEALHDVATLCSREGIRLLFLCLCLRPPEATGEAELSQIMNHLYRSVATARGVADCLLQIDILGEIAQSQYIDSAHIGPDPSMKVAQAVAARLREPIPVPRGGGRGLSFAYLNSEEGRIDGPGERMSIQTSVFEGPSVTLRRGGACVFETKGRLVALLLRSTEESGSYTIRAGDSVLRKNAQSLARENVPNLMALHYVTAELPEAPRASIEMTGSEEALTAAPYDLTLMDGPPLVPFGEQTLELAGAMVRRRRSWLDKAKARLFRD